MHSPCYALKLLGCLGLGLGLLGCLQCLYSRSTTLVDCTESSSNDTMRMHMEWGQGLGCSSCPRQGADSCLKPALLGWEVERGGTPGEALTEARVSEVTPGEALREARVLKVSVVRELRVSG